LSGETVDERPNIYEPRFDDGNDAPGFANRRARLGRQAGGERLGASLFEVGPGAAPFPLHYHLANEEMLIVVAGSPTLRTATGERPLEPGEVVAMPVGERGAHQLINRTGEAVRFLIVSEMNAPDVVIRPESGKLSAFGRAPGSEAEGFHDVYFRRDAVEFWEGEPPP
jgi:uncharacterized cupin superfamily protein